MASEVVDLFTELAAISSPPGEERPVADAVARYLRDLGLTVDEDGAGATVGSNMPGAVPITSTKALTNATLPYVEAIAEHGLAEAVARDPALARGVNVLDGKITYEAVADAHGLDYQPLDDVLPLSAV